MLQKLLTEKEHIIKSFKGHTLEDIYEEIQNIKRETHSN